MNKYQTVYTEEDFKGVPNELKGEFYEILESIQFVKWLTQPEDIRGYAKDRPRYTSLKEDDPEKLYSDDRIIVDITKPHILENLDFFRERAIFFDKNGKYTNIPSSPNPKSEYAEFWKEELKRWKYGLIRPSDGEWIPGALYFYWNYCPIWLVEETGKKVKGKKTEGRRVRKFPHPWLGDYLFYHYLEQAKSHGQHVKVLKTRGVGISFKMGSLSPRNMYVYPGSGNPNFHLASDKSYLQGDKGVFGKVMDTLDWIAEHTPLPKLRLGDSKRSMEIQLGYQDEYGVRQGLLSSVFGISLKDNPDKAHPLYEKVWTTKGLISWKDVKIGTELFSIEGTPTKVIGVKEFYNRDIFKITFKDGREVFASRQHEFPITRRHHGGTKNKKEYKVLSEKKYSVEQIYNSFKTNAWKTNSFKIKLNNYLEYPYREVPIDSYTLGLLLGDGSFKKHTNNKWTTLTMVHKDINEITKFIPYKVRNHIWGKTETNSINIINGRDSLKSLDLYDKIDKTKFIPDIYKYNSREVRLALLNGLLDTDGSCTKDYGIIEQVTVSKRMAEDLLWLIRSLGFGVKQTSTKKTYTGNICYRTYIYYNPKEVELFKLPRKKNNMIGKKQDSFSKSFYDFITIKNIELVDNNTCRCVEVAHPSHKYLIGKDLIPTFNSRGIRGIMIHYEEDGTFDHLEDAWNINRKAAEDGDVAFATMYALGCVCEGTKVWTKNFKQVNIEDLKQEDGIIGFDIDNECAVQEDIININPPAQKECVKIYTNYRTIECSIDHPILVRNQRYSRTDEIVGIRKDYNKLYNKYYYSNKYKPIIIYGKEWKEAGNIKQGDKLLVATKIGTWGNESFKNIREEKVIKVEVIGKKNIYNLTTSTTHTYLANNIITHNTGGSMGSAFAGSEKLFYHPETYNIYGLPNVFDKNSTGETKCGFFWGSYLNRNGCYDKTTGEPDVTKAIFEVLLDRYLVKKGAGDSKAITQKKAEEPITPQDAVMRVEGTIFPVADLKDYLAEIIPDMTRFTSSHYIGRFDINGVGEVKFTSTDSVYPIRDFPALDNRLGAVEIFEMPKKVKDENRYIIGQDGYDDDEVTYSVSLGSVFAFDTWTRRIVAEYTGRPATANEFYEIVYRMARFYNGKIMYENNKKGLFNYFANVKKSLEMLADTPEYLSNKQIIKAVNINNTTKGVNATLEVNKLARRLQADWMVEDAYVEEKVYDEDGNDISPKIPNYRKIRSIGYLKEAIAWNNDINCDRISALGMVMLYAAELQKYETNFRKERVKGIGDDPFFNKHYRTGNRMLRTQV